MVAQHDLGVCMHSLPRGMAGFEQVQELDVPLSLIHDLHMLLHSGVRRQIIITYSDLCTTGRFLFLKLIEQSTENIIRAFNATDLDYEHIIAGEATTNSVQFAFTSPRQ